MQKFKDLIECIFTKKNIKIFLLLFIVVWFFVWASFADTTTATDMTPVKKIGYLLHILISILSWVWVVLATLAWKLMTNEFVYWSFLHLDKALWDLWNIMKNFANFALWFILVGTIVKNLFKWSFGSSEGDPIKWAKDTIVHTFIAWVLVQMSRFLIAALLDLSTIATAAVWSLPSQFMSNNSSFQTKIQEMMPKTTTKLYIDFSNNWDIVEKRIRTGINTEEDLNRFLDTIMPGPDSLGWTLMFLWASVFNLFELSDTSTNVSWTYDIWDLVLSLWINWFVLLSFSLMLALIFVFNLFRVITLWIIIPLMPFVVLVAVFSKGKNNKITWFLSDVLDYKKIIKLVFKPVYMTLVLSIILIVMVLIRALAKSNGWLIDLEQNNMTIRSEQVWSGYTSSLDISKIATIKLNMRESFVDLLVYILWLALMFMLMKSCMSGDITWIKFIDEKISWLSKSIWGEKWKIWWILWSAWIVPIWWGKKVWLSKITEFKDNVMSDGRTWANALWIDVSKQDKAIEDTLWWGVSFSVLGTITNRDAWIKKAVELWRDKYKYKNARDMYATNEDFKNAFDAWNNDSRKSTPDEIRLKDIDDVWEWKSEPQWWNNANGSTPQQTQSQWWNNANGSTPQQT